MGWIKAGNIELFSFADTISQITLLVFNIVRDLFNPYIIFVFTLFTVMTIIVMFSIIRAKIRELNLHD